MEYALLLIFPCLLILAGSFDLFTLTIPNWLTALVAISFFVLAFSLGLPVNEIGTSMAVAFGVLLFTMGMFGLGWFGGGDAKLMTAVALWIGATNFPAFLLGVCLIGGVATLAIVCFRQIPLPIKSKRFHGSPDYIARKKGFPMELRLRLRAFSYFQTRPCFR